ncbi:MAG: hypothetical protein Q4D92_00540 [Slackia sp.]|nr:hypothetical protein [Slackia sp.]
MGHEKKKIAIGVVVDISFSFGMAVCAKSSALNEADELYMAGSYREALDIYCTLEKNDEIESRINDCQFWGFIEYVRTSGGIEINHTEDGSNTLATVSIEARESGEIILTYEDVHTPMGVVETTKYTLSIPYGSKEAVVTGRYEVSNQAAKAVQTAEGILDIGLYSYGDDIEWDECTDDAKASSGLLNETYLGLNVLLFNAGYYDLMISDLQHKMFLSKTGCTMQLIGFENIDQEAA